MRDAHAMAYFERSKISNLSKGRAVSQQRSFRSPLMNMQFPPHILKKIGNNRTLATRVNKLNKYGEAIRGAESQTRSNEKFEE